MHWRRKWIPKNGKAYWFRKKFMMKLKKLVKLREEQFPVNLDWCLTYIKRMLKKKNSTWTKGDGSFKRKLDQELCPACDSPLLRVEDDDPYQQKRTCSRCNIQIYDTLTVQP